MPPPPRTTLGMIAARTGLSRSTVSRALRNHPQIPASTCSLVQETAREMGWRPDPEATRLMHYLKSSRDRPIDSAIAVINDYPKRDALRQDSYTRILLEIAHERAETLGFRLDEIWLREKGMSARRVNAILRARGIRGVLIPPEHEPLPRLELDWESLSVVATTTTALPHHMHRVLPDNFNNLKLVMDAVARRAWKKPMLLSLHGLEQRTENAPTLVYLASCLRRGIQPLPVFHWDDPAHKDPASALRSTLRLHKPDGLICADTWLHDAARAPKLPWICYSNHGPGYAGLDQRPSAIGAAAIDLLSAHILRGETGTPPFSKIVHIAGQWIES